MTPSDPRTETARLRTLLHRARIRIKVLQTQLAAARRMLTNHPQP